MSNYEFYLVDKKPPIAWVYLNRPDKLNAMHPPAWKESVPIFRDLDADDEIKVIIVSGKGNCFTAGIDLIAMSPEVPEIMPQDPRGSVKVKLMQKICGLQETMTSIERCKKPVIAAVHGYCIGAGVDMITACDIRLCSKDAVFSVREAKVAIVADVGTLQRLPHIVGQGNARELAYTAKDIDAARAKEINLVNHVYEDHAALMKGAEDMANEILTNSPLAVQASKMVLNFCIGKTIDDGLKYVAAVSSNILPSDDLVEAITARMEKRKPSFTGK